ncbi:MAG: radical SAM family heme chaperone HemW [Nitrospira sp.]|nr:radical SAM family heme chaperone HemW [Nitrospira sp.]
MDALGIYIHIPFCTHQCPFCAFSTVQYSKPLLETYMEALKGELSYHLERQNLKGRKLQSIYLGGGTPSLIPEKQLLEMVDLCRGVFEVPDDLEVTIEATPESIHPQKARALLREGVNRLSLGAQSFSDHELKLLGRNHTAEQTRRAVFTTREAGFTNINLDLIYALPGQSLDPWRFTLEEALALEPQHISFYGLTLEEGTSFYEFKESGRLTFPDEDEQSIQYETAQKLLMERGFEQYEVSNFSKPSYHCRHNLIYWSDEEYLGLGASAHSHLNGRRFANCFDPQAYIHHISIEGCAVVETEHLTPEKKAREAIAFGLRRTAGFNLQEILNRYRVQPPQDFYQTLQDLQSQGLLAFSADTLKPTPKGLLVSDHLATTLLSV